MENEQKAIRLSKIAREFNVGLMTIVEFLKKKGHSIDANPNTKISQDLYSILIKEFSSDLTAKQESEQINLKKFKDKPESISINDVSEESEENEENQEEELLIKDLSGAKDYTSSKEESKPELKITDKTDLDTPKQTKAEDKEEPEEEEPEIYVKQEKTPEPEVKVVGKIDLDSINQLTRPPKKSKEEKEKEKQTRLKQKKAEKEVKIEEEIVNEEETEIEDEEIVIDELTEDVEKDNFIKSKFEPISGPTVIGKIDLPHKDKKKPVASSDENKAIIKKKRKRIRKETTQVSLNEKTEKTEQDRPIKKDLKKKKKRGYRQEVSEEDVQKQIKETLARLTTKGKSKGAKHRKEKRDAIYQKEIEAELKREEDKNILKVTEFVTVNELATMMNVPVNEIISSCMSLGLFVSINQRLDAETLVLVAEEFDHKVEFTSADVQESIIETEDSEGDLITRPPIVTVMGHVDHGKTKLLDYIRNANVIAGEAGGITQHIGAYHVELEDGRQITFLDTPGHEAFTAMRARGAQITDVAIIVVAADDGVMPQTVEAINHAHAAGVPIVFAINKIDKPTSNPEKIKEELANMNFLVEDWGGKYQSQEISAKSGTHIYELLDKVLLESELLELKANPNKNAVGTIIESSLDKGRGYVATVLVQGGTLQIGDLMLSGTHFGRVKAMYNERGKNITEAGPAIPVMILGLNGAPQARKI